MKAEVNEPLNEQLPQRGNQNKTQQISLSNASHPFACIFTFLFKVIAFLVYFIIGNFFTDVNTFIIVVILSALDFWTVKNVTGRLLVGLRWWNDFDEKGKQIWKFDSYDKQFSSNPVDATFFWISQIASTGTWAAFLVLNLLTFSVFWVTIELSSLYSVLSTSVSAPQIFSVITNAKEVTIQIQSPQQESGQPQKQDDDARSQNIFHRKMKAQLIYFKLNYCIYKIQPMMSQTETQGGAGQYGFYAVPKALEPKKKYRDNIDDQYEEGSQDQMNQFATIDDKQTENQKELDRDFYVDQAPYPQFKPRERGLDYGVQIQRGDLFDYDLEVRPLVQILVGRSVVSAINELQQEKQKEERKNNLDQYQKKRNAELMVTQRLETKHKRKLEETERRKLQKEVYLKNQREAGKKIIGRRNAKQCLLGLKNDLFNQLQDAGFLRSDPTTDLKIKYQQWLYERIMESLNFRNNCEIAAKKLIQEQEARLAEDHRKAIKQQMTKRQIVLDEREKARKEMEERKEKKRIKKMRQKLNSQRQPQFIKFQQLLERYQQVTHILKHGDRSNGFSRNFASRQSIYISGGLDNYLLALLESSNKDLSVEQIEGFLMKVITESGRQLDVSLLANHYDKIQEIKKRMNQNKTDFMKEKSGEVKDLAQHISLDLSLLQATNTPIKSTLHQRFIQALLSIYLTTQPEKTEQNTFELQEHDKKRLQFAQKIIFSRQEQSFADRLQHINEILRVHFQVLLTPLHSEASQKKLSEGEQVEEEQWFDIYDGEGWKKHQKNAKRQLNRSEQTSASYGLGSFENSFVYDERTLHYLQPELQKLLELNGDQKLKHYVQSLGNIRNHIKKDLAIFDGQIRFG